jgi:hypothetical protein
MLNYFLLSILVDKVQLNCVFHQHFCFTCYLNCDAKVLFTIGAGITLNRFCYLQYFPLLLVKMDSGTAIKMSPLLILIFR